MITVVIIKCYYCIKFLLLFPLHMCTGYVRLYIGVHMYDFMLNLCSIHSSYLRWWKKETRKKDFFALNKQDRYFKECIYFLKVFFSNQTKQSTERKKKITIYWLITLHTNKWSIVLLVNRFFRQTNERQRRRRRRKKKDMCLKKLDEKKKKEVKTKTSKK